MAEGESESSTNVVFRSEQIALAPETQLADGKTILYGGAPMLGEGTWGVVYPCMLKVPHSNGEISISHCAVKCTKLSMTSGAKKTKDVLKKELDNWKHLSQPGTQHENVLQMLAGEAIQTDDRVLAWAVTELMDMTLDQLIFEDRGFIENCTYKSLLQIAEKICKGLAHIHENFIHLDLKPANVLVSKNGEKEPRVKISDFGLTKKLKDGKSSMSETYRGTHIYMAPEIALAQATFTNKENRISSAVDIYSLGVLLWVLFNRKKPSEYQHLLQDTGKFIKWPNTIGVEDIWCRAPEEICDLIQSCLAYNPRDDSGKGHGRPSASEVRERISQMYNKSWASKRPPTYLQAGEIYKAELERVKGEKEKLAEEKKEIENQLEKAKADGGELEKRMREMAINHAAERGDWETIQELLDNEQLDVNAMSGDNSPPLHWAAGCGHIVLVQKLLEEGMEVDFKDKDGDTPFCCAVFHGHLDVAEVLLERGAFVDASDVEGCSPLHAAAACGHEEAVKFLIDHGANKDLKNQDGETPLDIARKHSLEGVVELLN